jgi:hypothetical protein
MVATTKIILYNKYTYDSPEILTEQATLSRQFGHQPEFLVQSNTQYVRDETSDKAFGYVPK